MNFDEFFRFLKIQTILQYLIIFNFIIMQIKYANRTCKLTYAKQVLFIKIWTNIRPPFEI